MTRGRLSIALVVLAFISMRAVGNGAGSTGADAARRPQPWRVRADRRDVFAGTPIDVDFQGSDLRTTLRLLADTGGINLVLDPSVPTNARVDIKLTQVPWDQVLDVLLKANLLTCIADGNVIRVLTRDSRTKELDEETKQRRASEQLPDLEKLQVRLNYASAAAIKELLKQGRIISERGTVDIDLRTNTLIVKDVARNLQDVRDLVRALDLPEPQVEIEAQIIETDHDSARALGIQWGFNGRATPELGNTTGLGFPNSGTISGRTGAQQGAGAASNKGSDPRASALEASSTAVNLPATGATSAVGLTLGAINGAFSLDVALSALEHKGRLKILSTPKVTTQNNKEAEVTTGFQVPFQTVSNNTVVIQFRDAALKLAVTPQVTAAGTVIMKIGAVERFPRLQPRGERQSVDQYAAGDHRSPGRRRRDDGDRRDRAEQRTDQERLDAWRVERAAAGLAVPAERDFLGEPGTSDLHHAAHSSGRAMSRTQVPVTSARQGHAAYSRIAIRLSGAPRWLRCSPSRAARARNSKGTSPAYAVLDQLSAAAGAKPTEFNGYLASDVLTFVKKNINNQQVCVPTVFEDAGRATFHLGDEGPRQRRHADDPFADQYHHFTRYHVTYIRADGRNTEGVDVPVWV